jgi:DNA-binding GntR family transcriptional regulator
MISICSSADFNLFMFDERALRARRVRRVKVLCGFDNLSGHLYNLLPYERYTGRISLVLDATLRAKLLRSKRTMEVLADPPSSNLVDSSAADSSILLSDMAYSNIKEAIRLARLQPGQALSETRLSRQLGISRTPVREALQMLAQEGLVQIIPGRAVTVASPTVQDVMDAIHVRLLLEPEVVRLAAKHITPTQLETLQQAQAGLKQAIANNDRAAWSRADNVYHETICAACPNQLLGELAIQYRNRVSYLSIDAQGNFERLAVCTDEHRQIVDAIAAHDSELAAQTMRDHIEMFRQSIFKRLSHR